jgi:hypothetical protein
LIALYRTPRHRGLTVVSAAVFLYLLLLNASFYYWPGGWTVGPRYMAASFPLLCVGLPLAFEQSGTAGRMGFAGLSGLSVAVMLAVLSTGSMPPDWVPSPVWGQAVPLFLRGQFQVGAGDFNGTDPNGAFNLGELLGLRGPASLLPLLAVWLCGGIWWCRRDWRLAPPSRAESPKELTTAAAG